jgi:type IV secretory pathway TrbD component
VAGVVLWFVAAAGMFAMAASNPEFKKAFEEEMQRQQQLQQQGQTPPPQN